MGATRRSFICALVGAALVSSGAGPAAAQSRDVLVFAAASLKNAVDDIAATWQREAGRKAVISYGGSNSLVQQIEQGAPADVLMSADIDWMDYAEKRNLIRPQTRANLLGNRIALIAPRDSAVAVSIEKGFDLRAALGGGRLAMGNVTAVPAGKYGKAALETLSAWDGVKDRVVQAENVRAALVFVARGETPLGIVYETDAATEPRVRVVGTFPEGSHPPIIYPVAMTTSAAGAGAAEFLKYLHSPAARSAFQKQGFTVLE